ncbi:hypothetical protein RE628_19105 [Paenibacillus sp. D2_2]|nr:hypothetical protein [Paenibacillus sp. D2_2]WMT39514.1 hypothetical protein RE628_19105 [Paenibacillus sp. D2_2]
MQAIQKPSAEGEREIKLKMGLYFGIAIILVAGNLLGVVINH